MKKITIGLLGLAFLLNSSMFAADGKALAIKLGLSASSKASMQWNRVFSKAKKMKRLGIDKLSDGDKAALKDYLIGHAADSDSPEAAGM